MKKNRFITLVVSLLLIFSMSFASVASAGNAGSAYTTKKVKSTTYAVIKNSLGTKTYTLYSQNRCKSRFVQAMGCTIVAASIVASSYGVKTTPDQIYNGKKTQKYSELYAVAQLKGSTKLHGKAAASMRTASRILTNLGISNTYVYTFSANTAIKQISSNLNKGKPVIILASNKTYKGVRIANAFHAIVLLGFDKSGKLIVADPMAGKLNYAHASSKTLKITLSDLVKHYMVSPKAGKPNAAYYTSTKMAGGYILITK